MKTYLIFARLIVLSFLLGTSFVLSGQQVDKSQIIRLKAGGSFQGSILSRDSECYKVILITGDTIKLKKKSVSAVIDQKKTYHFFSDGRFASTNGRYFCFLINTNWGYEESNIGNRTKFDFSPVNFSAGYRFNQKFELGIGTGVDIYQDYGLYLPIFAESRYYLSKTATSIFIGGKIGSALLLNQLGFWPDDESRGGLLLNPVLGFKSASRRKAKFIFEAGLKMQKAIFNRWDFIDRVTLYRYTIGAGLLF